MEPEQIPEQPVEEAPTLDVDSAITWQASEGVHHDKEAQWFLGLAGVAIVLLLVDVFLIKSWTFGVLIVVMAIGVAVVARRPPQVMNYALTQQGLMINDKQFHFHDFKSFGVLQDGAMYSVRLVPHRRFMPAVSVFFPPEYGEEIVDRLGAVLPMEELEPDLVDRLAQRMRF